MDATNAKRSDTVDKLRKLFSDPKFCPEPISAYIISHDDQHMSEYLADGEKRLEFVSGFSGSAGTVVITLEKAFLWTDARYYIQASEELEHPFELKETDATSETPGQWLAKNLSSGDRVGADPALFSCSSWKELRSEMRKTGVNLVEITTNLVDIIWLEKPPAPSNPVVVLPPKYSGRRVCEKIDDVVSAMQNKNVDVFIISELDNIAWLLNLRGSDIEYNPVFFSFVVIHVNNGITEVQLYCKSSQLPTPEIKEHLKLEGAKIEMHQYDEFYEKLTELANSESTQRAWVSTTSNAKILSSVPPNKRYVAPSVVTEMKAVKNKVEAQGMINAHVRDGYALCSFLHHLEEQIKKGETYTEISAATKLEHFRSLEEGFRRLSFATISSVGAHAAIIHHHPSPSTDKAINVEDIYLVDSGGQYWDGTTDVTRTVHLGVPTDYQKECFTRVLKGVIALNTARFPQKLKSYVLDAFARRALWDVGLEYGHGTGHGIGAYLCVHEGPMSISWRPRPDDSGLEADMFVSNEPGYYEAGNFGIRIENIEQIVEIKPKYPSDKKFLTFKTVTMCPIQTKLIDPSLLSEEEVDWVNKYHQNVRETLVPIAEARGNESLKKWLLYETKPLCL